MKTAPSVLYDEPGPRTRRLIRRGSIVAWAVLSALLVVVVVRLADAGQFDAEKWHPLIDPGDENFAAVWDVMGTGLQRTLVAAALAIAFSLIVGTAIGVLRLSLGRLTRIPLVGAMEVVRGVPVVISIYFASRVLPELGLTFADAPGGRFLWYLVVGLTAYNSVIIAEILRAGVESLPRGQREAAAAIGLTRGQTLRLILLPQAFRTMLPALISQLVVILKDTSLAALILGQYQELLRASNLVAQQLRNPIPMFLVTGAIYIIINWLLSKLAEYVERRGSRTARSRASAPVSAAPTPLTRDSSPTPERIA
ncbi:amino acid ABC transporter permease [Streptomyces sp. NRRL B-3229]|uniref:amino acid ABC transporter permease n=1 Tax=Streptomyces sp. NRRL B-3229 TaxID=1463836 RepID=UPI0004BE8C03|nr:amino acid ABC transporter permease [Streptomyces sp. NRRL B-3229]